MSKLTKPHTTGVVHRGTLLSALLDNLVSKRSLRFESVNPNEDTTLGMELDATDGSEVIVWVAVGGLSVPTLCTTWANKVSDTNIEVHVFHTSQEAIDIDIDVYTLSKQPSSA